MPVKKSTANKTLPAKNKTKKAQTKKPKTTPIVDPKTKKLQGSYSNAGANTQDIPTASASSAKGSKSLPKNKNRVSPTGRISEDRWVRDYKPMVNHLTPNTGWNFGEEERGSLFETYGIDERYVRTFIDKNRVWTLMDKETGNGQIISAGYSFVNRIGYFITEEPWEDLKQYISIPE